MFEKKLLFPVAPLLLLLLLLYLPAWALAEQKVREIQGLSVQGRDTEPVIHYDLRVELEPESHRLTARATITLPPEFPRRFALGLHRGLAPEVVEPGVELEADGRGGAGSGRLEVFTVSLPPGQKVFTLAYAGEIHHPLGFSGRDYARGVRYTPGRIDPDGVYLGPAAHWYPRLLTDEHFLSFRLRVKLPPGWAAVSQGRLLAEPQAAATGSREVTGHGEQGVSELAATWRRLRTSRQAADDKTVWEEKQPQQGIFLVADRFTVFRDQVSLPRAPSKPALAGQDADRQGQRQVTTLAYLREDDPALARRYLEATADYLRRYSEMLGPYPYDKFALVENAWESGFGMPSFTLLGSRVIRLPFILHTSYPHEILHNWWGNGVFTDYAAGNWNEGLTAYLADHLLMTEQGRGAEYRRGVLQKYADYAAGGRDFPLRRFTARHDPATEAVGYGKGLMLFHMLQQKLGRELFLAGLQDFYRRHLFTSASYADLQRSFEHRAQRSLDDFFHSWLERSGAPELFMENVALTEEEQGWRLAATFGQNQEGEPYRLQLPLKVKLEGEEEARRFQVPLTGRETDWQETFSNRPRQLALDPDFDLFRRLDRREIPAAFSRLFGAEEKLLVILPAAEEEMLPTYRELAASLARFGSGGSGEIEIVSDRELEQLPPQREVIILGWQNRFKPLAARALDHFEAELPAPDEPNGALRLAGQDFPRTGHAFALALPRPDQDGTIGWIALDHPVMLAGLVRRLPHYHRYGALVFQGDQAENILRHHWPAHDSPLHQNL